MTPKSKEELIEQRVKEASTKTKSDDPIVQLAWLADGIDLWHRTNGKRGHSPTQAKQYIISSATRTLFTRQDVKAICEEVVDLDYIATGEDIDSIIDKWGK